MRKIEVGSVWRHFKGINVKVIALAKDADDLSELVVYSHDGDCWVRKKDEFLSEVDHKKYPDITQKYRFELIGDSNV